jgi:hypothetical protein
MPLIAAAEVPTTLITAGELRRPDRAGLSGLLRQISVGRRVRIGGRRLRFAPTRGQAARPVGAGEGARSDQRRYRSVDPSRP